MRWAALVVALSCAGEISAREPAQAGLSTVRVNVPAVLLFQVADATPGQVVSAGAFSISFNQAALPPGQALRISVKADGVLMLPGDLQAPPSSISWTASPVGNGIGVNGTLSQSIYTPVYESRVDAKSGRVDVSWSLTVPAGITRAGVGNVTLRWKFEAVIP
jgi:hypothetical protein